MNDLNDSGWLRVHRIAIFQTNAISSMQRSMEWTENIFYLKTSNTRRTHTHTHHIFHRQHDAWTQFVCVSDNIQCLRASASVSGSCTNKSKNRFTFSHILAARMPFHFIYSYVPPFTLRSNALSVDTIPPATHKCIHTTAGTTQRTIERLANETSKQTDERKKKKKEQNS